MKIKTIAIVLLTFFANTAYSTRMILLPDAEEVQWRYNPKACGSRHVKPFFTALNPSIIKEFNIIKNPRNKKIDHLSFSIDIPRWEAFIAIYPEFLPELKGCRLFFKGADYLSRLSHQRKPSIGVVKYKTGFISLLHKYRLISDKLFDDFVNILEYPRYLFQRKEARASSLVYSNILTESYKSLYTDITPRGRAALMLGKLDQFTSFKIQEGCLWYFIKILHQDGIVDETFRTLLSRMRISEEEYYIESRLMLADAFMVSEDLSLDEQYQGAIETLLLVKGNVESGQALNAFMATYLNHGEKNHTVPEDLQTLLNTLPDENVFSVLTYVRNQKSH